MDNLTQSQVHNLDRNESLNDTGRNETESDLFPVHSTDVWYLAIPAVLICLCTVAVLINVRILVASRWLRRPISPTLFISLSLALADSGSASLLATGLLVNSLLPYGLGTAIPSPCLLLTLEAARLACVLVTMVHLLAQAGNHYLGILAPFKSRRWLTHNNVTALVVAIWVLPILFMFIYFSSFKEQGFQAKCDNERTFSFIRKQKFRGLYSILIFIPLIIMFFIYCHISVIVRKHQAGRLRYTRHSRHGREQESRNAQQQFDRNLKAIWTTLLILSSYMICLMPAVLSFSLICEDCYVTFQLVPQERLFIISSACNFLLVIKPLLNPLIYASRMQEIRAATRRMNDSCRKSLYPFVSASEQEAMFASGGEGTRTSTRRYQYSITFAQHIGNGYTTRSQRRRPDQATADL